MGVLLLKAYSYIYTMVTVRIKDDSKEAKAIIEMLKAFPFVEMDQSTRYNKETEEAIKEVRTGKAKMIRAKNATELLKKLKS